jgi:hypothetical protein
MLLSSFLMCVQSLFVFGTRVNGEYIWDYQVDQLSAIPAPRSGHTIVGSNKIIMFGGLSESGSMNDTYIFQNETWSLLQTQGNGPSPRSEHSASLIGNFMVVVGGWGRMEHFSSDCLSQTLPQGLGPCEIIAVTEEIFGDTYVLDLVSGIWSAFPKNLVEPGPRRGGCATTINEQFFLFGGHSSKLQARPEASSFTTNQFYRFL